MLPSLMNRTTFKIGNGTTDCADPESVSEQKRSRSVRFDNVRRAEKKVCDCDYEVRVIEITAIYEGGEVTEVENPNNK